MLSAKLAAVVVLVGVGAPVFGQSRPVEAPRQSQQARENEGSRLLRASRLPRHSQEVRDKGVPDGEVREALKAAKDKKVPAGEMADVAREHSRAIDEHGPTDNFGSFVKGKLNEGLRGRELAAAIRAEHAARGKGKGAIKQRGQRPATRGSDQDRRARDEMEAREKNARDREKNARDREADARARERDARERAEKAAKEREVKEKGNKGGGQRGGQGGGQGRGKGKN